MFCVRHNTQGKFDKYKCSSYFLTVPKSSEAVWENNDRVRGEKFHTILANGLSSELLKVLKSLVIHKNELKQTVKKLHNSDERTLAICEKVVGEEYAYAFGVDVDDALSHIENELTAA